jgi:2',3'-cyclic-nucleotide 2'-phosphodiesterase (5'-nucleotidase family)
MLRSGRLLFSLLILAGWSCSRPFLQQVQLQEYVFSDSTNARADSSIDRRIQPYRDSLNHTMAKVLAVSAQPLEKKQPEGALGDFVADACLQEANAIAREPADLAIFNHGGLRRGLPQGPVTLGDVFELMPFDNELVVMTINGTTLKELLDFVAAGGGAPVSGIRMQIHDGRADSIRVKGLPLDTSLHYRVLTSDYLANGGDRFVLFSRAEAREALNLRVRDAIAHYLSMLGEKQQTLIITTDGRIHYAP